jgi:formylglycine-generating enzyme required for sulfatase activity/serine/threonine protein kinase
MAAPRFAPGELFAGDYEVVRFLNEGGFGEVYEVRQLSTGRPRALKVLRREFADQPGFRERFLAEARVSARFDTDRVPDVVGAGVDEATGMPWITMELLVGEDLATRVKRAGPLAPAEVMGVFNDLLAALGAAHAAGVLHMDLKPENLFVTRHGVCKVLDFGISKVVAEARRSVTVAELVGSPEWMAPEQTEKKARASAATDVWALGLIAFYLLTGRYYWKDANLADDEEPNVMAVLAEVALCRKSPPPPASVRAQELGVGALVPRGFDAWFARCVAQNRDDRYPDARVAIPALLDLLRANGHSATAPVAAGSGRVSAVSSAPPSPPPVSRVPPTAPVQGPPARPASVAPTAPMIGDGRGIPAIGVRAPESGAARREKTVVLPPRSNLWVAIAGVLAGVAVTATGAIWWTKRQPRPGSSAVVTARDASAPADVHHEPRCPPDMVLLRGRTFWMGSPPGEGSDDEHPQHRVEMEPFCIDPYEVTVARFRAFWDAGHPLPSRNIRYPGGWEMRPQWTNEPGNPTFGDARWCTWSATPAGREQHPINCVDWDTAHAFCAWDGGKRLPSEAEWEFAARGTVGRKYPWGNQEPDATRANLFGREADRQYGLRGWNDGFTHTAPVGNFRSGATPDNIFDLAGNVWEWTADVYSAYSTSQESHSVQTGSNATLRVYRGGGWSGYDAPGARGALRNGNSPMYRVSHLGFRCARGVTQAPGFRDDAAHDRQKLAPSARS